MILVKSNWSRGPVQPGVRQVGGLWGRSEWGRGGDDNGGGHEGVDGNDGDVVTGGFSWFKVGSKYNSSVDYTRMIIWKNRHSWS